MILRRELDVETTFGFGQKHHLPALRLQSPQPVHQLRSRVFTCAWTNWQISSSVSIPRVFNSARMASEIIQSVYATLSNLCNINTKILFLIIRTIRSILSKRLKIKSRLQINSQNVPYVHAHIETYHSIFSWGRHAYWCLCTLVAQRRLLRGQVR